MNYRQQTELEHILEESMRQLYEAYLSLRDHNLREESRTSQLLQEGNCDYLLGRLTDELQELEGVRKGVHIHRGQQPDAILEGSQVGYWLMLLAVVHQFTYDDFMPHAALMHGHCEPYSEEQMQERRQDCLQRLSEQQSSMIVQGLRAGFAFIGWVCTQVGVSPLAPIEFDLEQMRVKGVTLRTP